MINLQESMGLDWDQTHDPLDLQSDMLPTALHGLSVLSWVQAICKGYRQMIKVAASKETKPFAKVISRRKRWPLARKKSIVTFHIKMITYNKTCEKQPLSKRPKIGFENQLSLNAGQKYCRMLQGEHSAILSIFIKLPFVIKIFVLSIFEWPFSTGYTYFR